MFLFVTASVNNDTLITMLGSLGLWLMVRTIVKRPTAARWALLGVLLGLASLAKLSALGMMPLAALTALAVARQRRSPKELAVAGLCLGLPVLFLGGWWYYRNWRLYGDPTGLSMFLSIVGRRYPVPTFRQLLREWPSFLMSFWGLFGSMNVPAPAWVYRLLGPAGAASLLAAPLYLWREWRAGRLTAARRLQLSLVGLWPAILFASLVRWTLITTASQARLLFPGLTAINLLMAMGLNGLLPRRYRAIPPVLICGAMLAIALLLPSMTIRPAYTAPTPLSEDELARITTRTDVVFGDKMRLLGYDLGSDRIAPGDDVSLTLYWESLTPMDADYTVFVHLVGAHDLILAQRDRYPGQGTYPTSLWRAMERAFPEPRSSTLELYAICRSASLKNHFAREILLG